jgi:imidazolonepropionase
MKVWKNLNQIATLHSVHQKDGRNLVPEDISLLDGASIVFDDTQIHWVGLDQDLPDDYKNIKALSLKDHCLTPELVDSHTHLVFAGDRSAEYTMRLNGADYQAIADSGGGILSSVQSTQNADAQELLALARVRIQKMKSLGVGTIEIKSGYGLTLHHENILSQVIHQLKLEFAPDIQIIRTMMAAHAVAKSFSNSTEYLNAVVIPLVKSLALDKVIDIVDIFHEQGYFNSEDVRALGQLTQELGLGFKTHADEFNDNDGAALACSLNALSTDHLLAISESGIQKLSRSNTVATLLPGTGLFLGKTAAPGRRILDAGAKVAIATDYNPGSCHFDQLCTLAAIAAMQYKMNISELWASITHNAAHAVGLKNQGALITGFKPRFTLFKAPSLAHITYHWGHNFCVPQPK